MLSIIELLDIETIVFELYDGTFIFINITIVRSTKYSDYWWKITTSFPSVHFVPFNLSFMSSDDA